VGKEHGMYYIGIDLHKQDLVMAVEDAHGPVAKPRRLSCRDMPAILAAVERWRPFRAVVEASASYRWLYDLLAPSGEVVLAHPLRLRAIATARAKTDKLDAALLARLLRADLIPASYVPPARYQTLRDLTRSRARLSHHATLAKNQVHALLARANVYSPFKTPFGIRGRRWLAGLDLGSGGNLARDELLRRLEHYGREVAVLDGHLERVASAFPEAAALDELHGVGRYSALLIVAEIGEPTRFKNPRQVGAYAGLTARVHQSGKTEHRGGISKQGSRWLRWILVQAAMKLVRRDERLANFYTRIRKRAGRNVARVAVARKLAGICWVRLRAWQRAHAAA
jgi:transposase